MYKKTTSSGNVLFLILITVALFAALSYAVTSSSRTGGSAISKDKAKLIAAEIIQYTSQIEQAVSKMRLFNGCNDTDISLYTGNYPYAGGHAVPDNAIIPPPTECNVFHPDGGGLPAKSVPKGLGTDELKAAAGTTGIYGWLDSYTPFRTYIKDVGENYRTATDWDNSSDLVVAISMTNMDICKALNEGIGIDNPDEKPPEAITTSGNAIDGACTIEGTRTCSIGNAVNDPPEVIGKYSGCFYQAKNSAWISTPRYIFYHVIWAK